VYGLGGLVYAVLLNFKGFERIFLGGCLVSEFILLIGLFIMSEKFSSNVVRTNKKENLKKPSKPKRIRFYPLSLEKLLNSFAAYPHQPRQSRSTIWRGFPMGTLRLSPLALILQQTKRWGVP
jgi:hypothetical protein